MRLMGQCRSPFKHTAYALVAVLAFAAPSAGYAASPDDPWEPANRGFYVAYQTMDHWFIGPVARGYKTVLPVQVRKGLRNLINNLKEPGIALNDLLQAHPTRSGRTVARFVVNSTVGVGGLFDAAYNIGLKHHDNGFGTTAGRYGILPGPYIFFPLIGPTNIRDLLGYIADMATDPLAWAPFQKGEVVYARAIVDGLDQRAEADDQLKAIEDMSTDPYASLRSLYEQNRAGQIAEAITGVPGSAEPQLDDFDDPGAAPVSPAPPGTPPAGPGTPGAPAPSPAAALDHMMDGMMADMLAKPLAPMAVNARSGVLAPVESPQAG
jgi:phospholipid-binding lipoprotein MlaA